MSVVTRVSKLTRKFPKSINFLRMCLPNSLKRKVGAFLLMKTEGLENVECSDGRKFVTIPDRVFLTVFYEGEYESEITSFVRSFIQPTDVCVDVGANFGWYSTLMGSIASKVWAFEPGDRIGAILSKNIELNNLHDTVNIRKVAAGSSPGKANYVVEGDQSTESALGYVENSKSDESSGLSVDIVTLSSELADDLENISLMKIDVEGFEYYALQGAELVLESENPPVIICEANVEALERAGSTRSELKDFLNQKGYTLYEVVKDGYLKRDDGNASDLLCIPAKGEYKTRAEKWIL